MIEYDGGWHFRRSAPTIKDYRRVHHSDTLKNKWARVNKYRMLRFPYILSDETVHHKIVKVLEIEFDIRCNHVTIDYELAKRTGRFKDNMEDIVAYCESNGVRKSAEKYGVSINSVSSWFRSIHHETYREFHDKRKNIDGAVHYYTDHIYKDVQDKYGFSTATLSKYFKKKFGVDKRTYLKQKEQGS